jgi:acetylornithine deacetylase/succinyl-diaminopimelate desuccinylase-like protein
MVSVYIIKKLLIVTFASNAKKMEKVKTYIENNRERFIDELIELLKIPSVSADPKYKADVMSAAEAVKNRLTEAGADNVEVCQTEGYPVVYGEKIINPDLPTVLVYGHYDVQPPDPMDLWNSPPFEPVIKDEKIYARGASDDKGQMYMHVKAFELMMKTDSLPCNVKFMIEGEEEVGSEHLAYFIKEYKSRLKADIILISDTSIIANDTPSINVGLRGLSYNEVEVTGPNRDLHSGLYGGAVANPANILCEMIAKLKDENNHITIPGFYDDVIELSDEERAELAKAPFSIEKYKKSLDLKDVHGEAGYTTTERASIRPTLDVNGIWGGYTGEGAKTVIASKAFAKISMRLVPNQDPDKITGLFQHYFESIAPDSVKVKVMPHHGGKPILTPLDSVGYQAASKAMEHTFGKKPVPVRGGGSIPIVALFKEDLGLDSIMMGFGLDSDAIHSPNEHFGIFNYLKGIETIPYFFKFFTELSEKKQ